MHPARVSRRARAFALRTVVLSLATLGTAGCEPTPSVDDQAVGFAVRETMRENSCGPQSMPLLSVLQYNATILVRGTSLIWSVPDSRIRATGVFVPGTREFRISAESYLTLRDADRVTGRAACVLRRLDVIDGVLSADPSVRPDAGADSGEGTDAVAAQMDGQESDAAMDPDGTDGGVQDASAMASDASTSSDSGVMPVTFGATETIVYGPVQGADCSDMIGADDGQYSALPCQVEYAIAGEPGTTN